MPDLEPVVKAHVAELRGVLPPANSDARRVLDAWRKSLTDNDHPLAVVAGVKAPGLEAALSLNQANIGSKYNEDGTKADLEPAEADRKKKADEIVTFLSQITKGEGVDALANNTYVKALLESVILQNSTLRTVYNTLPTDEDRRKYRENLLRDKTFIDELIRLWADRGGPEKLIQESPEGARLELEAKKAEVDALNKKKKEIEENLTNLREEQKKFTTYTDASGSLKEGEFVGILAELKRDAESASKLVEQLKSQLETLNKDISKREADKGWFVRYASDMTTPASERKIEQMNQDLEYLKGEREAILQRLQDAQRICSEKQTQIQAIESRKAAVDAEIQRLETDLRTIDTNLSTKNQELAKAKKAYIEAKLRRETAEAAFVSSLERIIPEAAAKAINEKMDKLMKAQIEVEKKKAEEAKTKVEQDIWNKLLGMWRDSNGKIKWDEFKPAWDLFLQGGVDMVLDGKGTVNGVLNGITIDGVNVNAALLKSNYPELYQKLEKDIKQKMGLFRLNMPRQGKLGRISTFLAGPETISKDEAMRIIDVLGDQYITDLMKQNKGLSDALQSIDKEGMLSRGTKIKEFLRKVPYVTLLGIIVMLLLGGVAGTRILGIWK
jgi:hypothetical protein